MKRFLTILALALALSVPALADGQIDMPGDVKPPRQCNPEMPNYYCPEDGTNSSANSSLLLTVVDGITQAFALLG